MSQWKAFVQDERYLGRLRLHLMRKRPESGVREILHATTTSIRDGEVIPEGAYFMQDALGEEEVQDFIRAIMTAGWELGIRPDGFENHKNELKAVRDHLADMRKLAKVPNA